MIFLNDFLVVSLLANQNVRTVGGGVVKRPVGFATIVNSASHSPCILIGQMQREAIRKLSRRCQKSIKNFFERRRLDELDFNIRRSMQAMIMVNKPDQGRIIHSPLQKLHECLQCSFMMSGLD